MIIHFISLHIENFKSIGKADIILEDRGLVTVTGINNYENNVNSNGSGKSSIFSSLFWALFGKTPEGISNASNRYSSGRCSVTVCLNVDNVNYKVTRSMKSSQDVVILANDSEVSCRNRTDSDKYIKDSILRMSSDTFLSLIYLSQGFGSRLSLLTPSGRKDRIESLINISTLIDKFGDRVQDVSANKNNVLKMKESEYNKLVGEQSSYDKLSEELRLKIEECRQFVDYFEYNGRRYTSQELPKLQESSLRTQTDLNSHKQQRSALCSEISSLKQRRKLSESEISRLRIAINNDNSVIQSLHAGICPTCNQAINEELNIRLKREAEERLEQNKIKVSECESDVETVISSLERINDELSKCDEAVTNLQHRYDLQQYVVNHIPRDCPNNEAELNVQLSDYTQRSESLNVNIEKLRKDISDIEYQIGVISHMRQLITKSFRTYLLRNAINFMNNRLQVYSNSLFSNEGDIVFISSDSQKLDIYLGEAAYESLSGGEQRRADIPLMLAQRDLAAEVAGVSSNLLILDEILESMDEKATQCTLQLLEDQSADVESMYIISHNQYSLPVDSRIIVEKGLDRVATVSEIQ